MKTTCHKCGSTYRVGREYPTGAKPLCFECWLQSDDPEAHPEHMQRAHANAMHLADQFQAELRESIKAEATERGEPLSKVTRTLTGYAQSHTREPRRLIQNIGLAALAGLSRLAAEKCEEYLPKSDQASDYGEAIEALQDWAAAEPGRVWHIAHRADMESKAWTVGLYLPRQGHIHMDGDQLAHIVPRLLRLATQPDE